ncbi:MAG TPA: ABC transporter permease, partial [bacterium]|nr:ABC transporter permease [bacterium]
MVERTEVIARIPEWRAGVGFYQDAWRRLRRNRAALLGLVIICLFAGTALLSPLITAHDPIDQDLDARLLPPSRAHWLGTDDLGRDLLTRIIYGGRVSLTIGIVSVGIALAAGTLAGLSAGYYGRWVDSVTMRVMDIMLAFPATLLAIFI